MERSNKRQGRSKDGQEERRVRNGRTKNGRQKGRRKKMMMKIGSKYKEEGRQNEGWKERVNKMKI